MLEQYEGQRKGRTAPCNLREWIHPECWPTPRASEYKDSGPVGSKSHTYMLEKSRLCATVKDESKPLAMLNPYWVEWLMGWPVGWTSLDKLVSSEILEWSSEPDIDRVIDDCDNRAKRIKMLGNGQVPAVVFSAWGFLVNFTLSNALGPGPNENHECHPDMVDWEVPW